MLCEVTHCAVQFWHCILSVCTTGAIMHAELKLKLMYSDNENWTLAYMLPKVAFSLGPKVLEQCTTPYMVYLPVQWLLQLIQPSLPAHQRLHLGASPQLTCSILLCPLFCRQHSTTLAMILKLQSSARLAVLGWCSPSRAITTGTEEMEAM